MHRVRLCSNSSRIVSASVYRMSMKGKLTFDSALITKRQRQPSTAVVHLTLLTESRSYFVRIGDIGRHCCHGGNGRAWQGLGRRPIIPTFAQHTGLKFNDRHLRAPEATSFTFGRKRSDLSSYSSPQPLARSRSAQHERSVIPRVLA
jgi:hypothetical protein